VSLDLDFDKAFPTERVGAYERLLLDAIAGRLNLFVRSDEQEQAWRWVEPILHAWAPSGRPRAGPRPTPPAAGGRGRQCTGGTRRLCLERRRVTWTRWNCSRIG
jgi:glucose-6-phosphate 1-dehydrogenase